MVHRTRSRSRERRKSSADDEVVFREEVKSEDEEDDEFGRILPRVPYRISSPDKLGVSRREMQTPVKMADIGDVWANTGTIRDHDLQVSMVRISAKKGKYDEKSLRDILQQLSPSKSNMVTKRSRSRSGKRNRDRDTSQYEPETRDEISKTVHAPLDDISDGQEHATESTNSPNVVPDERGVYDQEDECAQDEFAQYEHLADIQHDISDVDQVTQGEIVETQQLASLVQGNVNDKDDDRQLVSGLSTPEDGLLQRRRTERKITNHLSELAEITIEAVTSAKAPMDTVSFEEAIAASDKGKEAEEDKVQAAQEIEPIAESDIQQTTVLSSLEASKISDVLNETPDISISVQIEPSQPSRESLVDIIDIKVNNPEINELIELYEPSQKSLLLNDTRSLAISAVASPAPDTLTASFSKRDWTKPAFQDFKPSLSRPIHASTPTYTTSIYRDFIVPILPDNDESPRSFADTVSSPENEIITPIKIPNTRPTLRPFTNRPVNIPSTRPSNLSTSFMMNQSKALADLATTTWRKHQWHLLNQAITKFGLEKGIEKFKQKDAKYRRDKNYEPLEISEDELVLRAKALTITKKYATG